MGLFSVRSAPETRGQSLEDPAVPLSSESVTAILGAGLATDAGVDVSEFNAFRFGAFWRCVSLISGTIATLPLIAYTGVRDAPGPQHRSQDDSVLYRAPEGMTPMEFKESVMVHLLTWGNAYIRMLRDGLGQVTAFVLYRPWEVTPSRVGGPGTPKRYKVLNGPDNLTDDDVIHIAGLGYDGVRGLSPVSFMRQSIGLGIAVETFGAKFFGGGALMAGLLKSKRVMPQDKADSLKNRFRDKVAGLSRAHDVVVLDNDVDYQSIGIPPEDAQFLQTRQFTVNEIARWFGIPPHLIGDVDRTTSWGTGIAEQTLGFVRFTIGFWTAKVEQRFDVALHPGEYAAFDMDKLLRGDASQRAAFYASAVGTGWMSRAEVRSKENMDPAPEEYGLDQFETSLTEAIASQVAKGLAPAASLMGMPPADSAAPAAGK